MLWRLLRSERCRVTKVPAEADLFVVPVWPRPKNQSGWAAACDKDANRKLAGALVHMTPGTAHKHLIIIGKGQINPSGKCDDWWRSPRGLLRRAMRVAYSANHLPPGATLASEAPLTLPGTHLPWDYGPKHLTNATEADRLTPNVLADDVPWPHLVSVPSCVEIKIFKIRSTSSNLNGNANETYPNFEISTRGEQSSKNQPNRLRFDRARDF